jgi:hypothetical protein
MKRLIFIGIMMAALPLAAQTSATNKAKAATVQDDTTKVEGNEPPDMPPPGEGRPDRPPMDGQGGPGNGHGRPMGMPPGGGPGHGQQKESSVSKDGLWLKTGEKTVSGTTYRSTGVDENAIKVSGGTLHLNQVTINKTGADSNDGDGTSFYGTNAAILVQKGGTLAMQGDSITTTAVGANGIVASGGTVNVSDVVIHCAGHLSRGIHATNGGTINASNLHITTKGNNSSVIATDRGGGTVTVNGGQYKAAGKDCAVCYSTGVITVNHITGLSEQGEVGVIEGDNEININDCDMTSGDSRRGLMILQSGSGDAQGNNGRINITGGCLTLTSAVAPLIEITTSTQGTLTLKDVELTVPSGILLKADYNKRWHTTSPIAHLILSSTNTYEYNGDVTADAYATTTVTVAKGVTWNGAYDTAGTGKSTSVEVSGVWNLTADSHVGNVVVKEGGVINKNGHQLIQK